MNAPSLLIGPTLRYHGNPMRMPWDQAVDIDTDGGVLMVDGKIAEVGAGAALRKAHPKAEITQYNSDHLIAPGFVDAHVHYPQTAIIASWGKRLIDWLNDYTFPEEIRLHDPAYA